MASVAERRTIRADGPEKVTGSGRYAADLTLTGMLHAKLRYAGVAHGRITRLDTTRARALPGVLAVITQADVPDVRYGPYIKDRTLFASDVVRYEGEIVAAVAALTPELAQAAVDAIELEIEPLPVVDDVEAALADDSPLVHTDWESYESGDGVERSRNVAAFSSIEKGDVEAGMREADEIVKTRFVADASHAVPIEPRAIVAQWQGEKLTVWSSTQVPFDTRSGLAETLQLPESKVRVIVPHLGGGFGGKCGFHQEAHIAALARKAGRPVRLLFTRREEFLVPDRRREGMVIELETGVMRDGTIVARRGRLVLDNGAYTADAAFFPQLAAMHVAGPYRIPHLRIDSQIVYTNTQPSGSVRAPTAPQACWALEQHVDEVARRIGIDGLELRRRNVIDTGDVGPSGQTFEQIGMRECLDRAAEMSGYETAELPDDEAIGIAVGWWPSFPGASGAYVKINADGSGVIVTGAQECGTGAVMALRQLAAQELGMEPEDFTILYQDTDAGPYDTGATGSQTTLNNGRAVLVAADRGRRAAAPPDRRRARGGGRGHRARRRARAGRRLARPADLDRGARREGARGRAAARPRIRAARRDAGLARIDLHRRPRHGGLRGAAVLEPRGARPARPRHGRRARAGRVRRARLRQDPQPPGRRGPGRGRRADGHRPGADGGHPLRRRRPAAQRDAARVQAADDHGRAADPDRLGREPGARRRPARLQGPRGGAERHDGGGDRQRDREADRAATCSSCR